jgi:hypothetical protein
MRQNTMLVGFFLLLGPACSDYTEPTPTLEGKYVLESVAGSVPPTFVASFQGYTIEVQTAYFVLNSDSTYTSYNKYFESGVTGAGYPDEDTTEYSSSGTFSLSNGTLTFTTPSSSIITTAEWKGSYLTQIRGPYEWVFRKETP